MFLMFFSDYQFNYMPQIFPFSCLQHSARRVILLRYITFFLSHFKGINCCELKQTRRQIDSFFFCCIKNVCGSTFNETENTNNPLTGIIIIHAVLFVMPFITHEYYKHEKFHHMKHETTQLNGVFTVNVICTLCCILQVVIT